MLYTRADYDADMVEVEALRHIVRMQIVAGTMRDCMSAFRECDRMEAMCDKQLARTRFILGLKDGKSKTGQGKVPAPRPSETVPVEQARKASANGAQVRWTGGSTAHILG